jgi:hypothetical protein
VGDSLGLADGLADGIALGLSVGIGCGCVVDGAEGVDLACTEVDGKAVVGLDVDGFLVVGLDVAPAAMIVATGWRVRGEDVGYLADLDDVLETVSSDDDDDDPPLPVVFTTVWRVRGEDVGFLADLDDVLETVSFEDFDEALPPPMVVLAVSEQGPMTSHACCHAPPYTLENGSNPTWLQNAATPVNLHLKICVFFDASFIHQTTRNVLCTRDPLVARTSCPNCCYSSITESSIAEVFGSSICDIPLLLLLFVPPIWHFGIWYIDTGLHGC